MRESEFRRYLILRGLEHAAVDDSIQTIRDFETYLKPKNKNLSSPTKDDLRDHLTQLITNNTNTSDRLIALARYFWLIKENDLFAYLAPSIGANDIYESIGERLAEIAGDEKQKRIFDGFRTPPIGSDPSAYPSCTADLLTRLNSNLPNDKVIETLRGNHHKIPIDSFEDMKKRWESSKTLKEFLEAEHRLLVAELEKTMISGRFWYEQEITPEVIELVKADQTIQNGVLEGDVVIKTKIPFSPVKWLHERDPKMRRYYSCHCTLARESILTNTSKSLSTFCHCSSGYEKLPLEVALGVPLEVEMLENVLEGADRCRFAIKIPKKFLGNKESTKRDLHVG